MDQVEKTQLQQVAMLVRRKMDKDQTGHDFEHIQRVVMNAQLLLEKEKGAEPFLVLLACYLHDFYDEKLVTDVTAEKARLRQTLIDQIGLSPDVINEAFKIIDQISYSKNITQRKKLDTNGQIVQDADRLDALGSIGIIRAFKYGFANHRKDFDDDDRALTDAELTKANYRRESTTINHFYEKLFKLEKLMNTRTAKRIAHRRTKIMHLFVNEYLAERHGLK